MNKGKQKTIIIFGGAFNPPHLGHAKVIEIIMRNFVNSEIWLMPSANRRDKIMQTTSDDRIKMTELFLSELAVPRNPSIKISKLEIKNKKLSSTFETNQKLERLFPSYKFYFVIGSDIVGKIKKLWYRGHEVFNLINFIILKRPGHKMPKKLPPNNFAIKKEIMDKNISSTKIREIIKFKGRVDNLITPKVKNFIFAKKLYL